MRAIASQIPGVSIVRSSICSDADQWKLLGSVSLAFVRGIHWRPVDFPHKGAVTHKTVSIDDVIVINLMKQKYLKNKKIILADLLSVNTKQDSHLQTKLDKTTFNHGEVGK